MIKGKLDSIKREDNIVFWYTCPECGKHLGKEFPISRIGDLKEFQCGRCRTMLTLSVSVKEDDKWEDKNKEKEAINFIKNNLDELKMLVKQLKGELMSGMSAIDNERERLVENLESFRDNINYTIDFFETANDRDMRVHKNRMIYAMIDDFYRVHRSIINFVIHEEDDS